MKTMIFQLTMPRCGSWNGRWSGENEIFAIVKRIQDKKAKELNGQSFNYQWEDGWSAKVSCRISSGGVETRKVRRSTLGFCGYEWMVRSILSKGRIKAPSQV